MNKATAKRLSTILEKTEEEIKNREVVFENRSENWQESENGEAYEYKTAELKTFFEELETAIGSLDTYLE